MPFLDCTDESARALAERKIVGPATMVNFMRFREVADYSDSPGLAPDQPISGAEAYRLYTDATLPQLVASGGEVVASGTGGMFFIGPTDEIWDHVVVVRHSSIDAFLSFSTDQNYLAALGHRTAALVDCRLLVVEAD